MSGNSTSQALRQIRTLYAIGSHGGLRDAELVERFLMKDGADREDAFAALVERHGPMVLRVCRRMLSGSADADDAFQAVFLVLARRAGTIRRLDRLNSWLYGVAVRTAKEARRRSARQRAREERAMNESQAASLAADQGSAELLSLLDEELDRLPARYREALMLCELEGVSRKEAAAQLGLAEGTLSSRLSRGRALLRDRLSRRGVALGAGPLVALLPEPANAALPEPLADATVRLALKFAAGGVVPASVTSLAEGVLAVMSVARLKLVLAAVVALAATAGAAWAIGLREGGPPPQNKRPADAEAANAGEGTTKRAEVRGVIVDEAGRPVAGAEVLTDAYSRYEARGTSGADGSFAIPIQRRRVEGTRVLARSADGRRAGSFRYDYELNAAAARAPVRIVLKPAREVVVHVADANQAPAPGVAVEAAGNYAPLDHATTGPDGTATLRLPAGEAVEWIVALKPGQGCDYAEFGTIDADGQTRGVPRAGELPASVALVLKKGPTARIKAVDSGGTPLAGIGFYLWLLHKEGRRSQVNFASRLFTVTTDPDGVAAFDWLPPSSHLLQIFPASEHYAMRRVIVNAGETATVIAPMTRTATLRGRVTRPDGTPAPNIDVRAHGSGKGMDDGQSQARTAPDGSYEMDLSPGEAYAVFVDDRDWAAPARLGVIVLEGKPVEAVDFVLGRGTIVRGTVTIGPGGIPAERQRITLIESRGEAPAEVREPGDRIHREVRRQLDALTDVQGRYSFRVGPGIYTMLGPPRTGNETITVEHEAELVRDFRMPRPETGLITGRVLAGREGRSVAGARVQFVPACQGGNRVAAIADGEGRFHAERWLDKTVVWATSPDGSLGAITEIGALDPELTISLAPTVAATGRLLDETGKPVSNRPLHWGRRVFENDEQTLWTLAFAPKVVTDAEGRFTLPSLVVGQEYVISLEGERGLHHAGFARPDAPSALDLGTLRARGYRPRDDKDSDRTAPRVER